MLYYRCEWGRDGYALSRHLLDMHKEQSLYHASDLIGPNGIGADQIGIGTYANGIGAYVII